MSKHYEIDGFEVLFTPWYSEYLSEDFIAVSVWNDGREVYHAGMTKLVPSEQQAREIVETMLMLRESLGSDGECENNDQFHQIEDLHA